MLDPRLIEYINSQLKNGVSNEQIKQNLLGVGWLEVDIDKAFQEIISNNSNINSENNINTNNNLSENNFINPSLIQNKTKPSSISKVLWILLAIILISGVSLAAYKYVYLPSKVNLPVKNDELINNATSSTTTIEINSNQNTYIIATSTATSSQDFNNDSKVKEEFKNRYLNNKVQASA